MVDLKWQAPTIQSEIEDWNNARGRLFGELRKMGFFEKLD